MTYFTIAVGQIGYLPTEVYDLHEAEFDWDDAKNALEMELERTLENLYDEYQIVEKLFHKLTYLEPMKDFPEEPQDFSVILENWYHEITVHG